MEILWGIVGIAVILIVIQFLKTRDIKKFILVSIFVFSLSFTMSAEKPFAVRDGNKIETFNAADLKDFVFSLITQNIKQVNAQLPAQIDEYTTLYSVLMVGSTISYNYTAHFDSSLLTESEIHELCDEIRSKQTENFIFWCKQNSNKMPASEWIRLFASYNIKYNYNYFDENGVAFARITIDCSDLK